MSDDLIFLSMKFRNYELPQEKKYLLKYFRTPVQEEFLRYYLLIGNIENFIDHTGHYCQKRWLRMLIKRIQKLEYVRNKAKSEFDLEELARIESGKLRIESV